MRTSGDRASIVWTHVGVCLASAAGLLFQVAQTRLFSTTLGYHLTYLVISVCLLGVGAGATCSSLFDQRPRRPSRTSLALTLGASCLLSLAVQTHVDPFAVGLPTVVATAYVLGSLPFTFASWIVVRSLRERPQRTGSLYAADLAGAATGSIGAFLGITPLGVPALYGVAASLATAAAVAFRPTSALTRVLMVLPLAATVALYFWSEDLTPPRIGPGKDLTALNESIPRLEVRWDPLARVDVFGEARPRPEPGPATNILFVDGAYPGPWPDTTGMLLDMGVATPVLGGDVSALRASVLAAPYAVLRDPSVLVIGPGGGIDIHNALVHDARHVDAVEVNRAVVDLMRGPLADRSGDIYLRPQVRVFEDEARSFVRRSTDRYDLIAMTVVDSYTALASGSYALSESYLYTDEAFRDYFDHLTSSGVIAAGRWYRDPPIEIVRTVVIAAHGFRAAGVTDVEQHVFVLRQRNFGLVLVSRTAFDARSADAIRRFAGERGLSIAYDPTDPSEPFSSAMAARTSDDVTDDRPFFFADEPTFRAEQGLPVAYAILSLALFASAILSYVLLLLPQRLFSRTTLSTPPARRTTLQAALVGLGFIATEIVILQRLTLYLGQPALALSLGLAGLLLGAAFGSAVSKRINQVGVTALGSSIALTLVLGVIGAITSLTLDSALPTRIAIALIAVGLQGLPLGAVFPSVVARAAAADLRLVDWAWAVNGAASVIGSILAVALAIAFGFTYVAAAGVICYATVAFTARDDISRALEERLFQRPPTPAVS